MSRRLLLPVILSLWIVPAAAHDYYSFANVERFRQREIGLRLIVDFTDRQISGSARIRFEIVGDGASRLVLDTRQLEIEGVRLVTDAEPLSLNWRLGEEDPIRGRPLTVDLPPGLGASFALDISYRTTPDASGLQWVTPAQTAGGESPFLFTQSQAIHARTWVPLQDTPAVRFKFEAIVQTPAGLRAVMGAEAVPEIEAGGHCVTAVGDTPQACFRFRMPQPIPSYLLALAVGDLEFRPIGARTGVYAEPALLTAAVEEFADAERMLERAEQLFGPYRWGRYDLLILPPSYPYGGMENPRLSFITPTVIAGDRSLVSLIAHELAHSWSGNLVTNASWADLWLNEGFTNLLEARLMEALYGERRRRQEDLLGYRWLLADLENLGPEDELLAAELDGADPDDAFSAIAYEKGKLFLVWLEEHFGRERWDAFMNRYFDEFAFRSVSTAEFLTYLDEHLISRNPGHVDREQIREWVYEPGLPDDAPRPDETVFSSVGEVAREWLAGEIDAREIETGEWSTQDWVYFLGSLPVDLPHPRLEALDTALDLRGVRNNEILSSWLMIVAASGYEPAFPQLRDFLIHVGRLKYIEPLYKHLMETEEGAAFARATLEAARPGYHPQTVRDIERIVARGSG